MPDSTPFLLSIDLKEKDSTAFRLLVTLLRSHEELFVPPARPMVQVVLVGWWPGTVADQSSWPEYLRIHAPIGDRNSDVYSQWAVGLVSIDYGKHLKWSGWGPVSPAAMETMAEARRVAMAYGVPIRVHHAPARRRIYEWLVAEGVTLIGSGDLTRDRKLLLKLSGQPPDTRPNVLEGGRLSN